MSRPGVLLDRDGTINVDSGYVGSVDRVEFIDGSAAAIAALNRAGLPVAVVTNQAGVARGHYGIEDVQQVHKHMDVELARHGAHVDLWLFCPYHPDGVVEAFARPSSDRKPGPGLALAAAHALDLDLGASWVVGDSLVDVGLARAVGARAAHVGPVACPDPDVASFPDLAAAVEHILAGGQGRATTPRAAFPRHRYADPAGFGAAYAGELARAMASVDPAALTRAADLLDQAYAQDRAVFVCGNGGSAAIADHLQCDHVKGLRNGTGLRTRVFSLNASTALLSAVANDHGYDAVFEHQLQSFGRRGDVLLVVSSSGRSPNVVRALEWARANGLRTLALTGFTGGAVRELAEVAVHVDAHNYGVVEDAHQACMHLLAQYLRQSRMADADVTSHTF